MGQVSFGTVKVDLNKPVQFDLAGFGAPNALSSKPSKTNKTNVPIDGVRSSARPVGVQRAEIGWLRQQLAELKAGKLSPAQTEKVRVQADALVLKAGSPGASEWSQQDKLIFFGVHNEFAGQQGRFIEGGKVVDLLEQMRHATRRSPTKSTDGSWSNQTKYWLLNDTLYAANQQFRREGAFWSAKDAQRYTEFQKNSVLQLNDLRPYKGTARPDPSSQPSRVAQAGLQGLDMNKLGWKSPQISPKDLSRWLSTHQGLTVTPETLVSLNRNRLDSAGKFATKDSELLIPQKRRSTPAVASGK